MLSIRGVTGVVTVTVVVLVAATAQSPIHQRRALWAKTQENRRRAIHLFPADGLLVAVAVVVVAVLASDVACGCMTVPTTTPTTVIPAAVLAGVSVLLVASTLAYMAPV